MEVEKGKGAAEEALKEVSDGIRVLTVREPREMEVEKGKKGAADEALMKEVADGDRIILKSSDGKPFEVSKEAAARLSRVLAEMIAGGCGDGSCIKLEKIGSEALEKVVDYCNKHANSIRSAALSSSSSSSFNTAPSKELEEWDRKIDDLFNLVKAADFLGMDGLLDVTCHKIAGVIEGKSLSQMREMFNIKNDFREEEDEEEILPEA